MQLVSSVHIPTVCLFWNCSALSRKTRSTLSKRHIQNRDLVKRQWEIQMHRKKDEAEIFLSRRCKTSSTLSEIYFVSVKSLRESNENVTLDCGEDLNKWVTFQCPRRAVTFTTQFHTIILPSFILPRLFH